MWNPAIVSMVIHEIFCKDFTGYLVRNLAQTKTGGSGLEAVDAFRGENRRGCALDACVCCLISGPI